MRKQIGNKNGDIPVILIGFSWGAWLSFIFAARYPTLVKKLILIGSEPFAEKYALNIMKTRLSRLGDEERREVLSLMETLNNPYAEHKDTPMAKLVESICKADCYRPLPHDHEILAYQHDIHRSIWEQAVKLRSNGQLLELGGKSSVR